jgi:serine/threonine-protein kinase
VPRLVVEKGKDKGKVLSLRENVPYLIGRDLKTHLRLRDQQVSRRHLKITYKLGEVHLEDLDSSNGTFVNGARVRSASLHPDDKIQVGETLIFYLEDESQDDSLVAPVEESGPVALESSTAEKVRKGELTGHELSGYKIGRLLGRGGMGTVYEALQVSLERRVAFKVLAAELAADGQFVDRFTAEARAAGQLNHPNIVQVYDVGVSGKIRFYSMEYMARGSVEDLLRRDGRLSLERALPIVFDAARGLEYAERHGVVHRDIKPDNLMMSEDGVVKIGDLGIATRRRREGEEANKEDGVSGSPHYMAPEQAMGRDIDQRADLYALGVSLYQMLSGDTPYEGASAREVILKHLNEPPPPLKDKCPDLAPEVVALVERLMEKDPSRRLASASLLLQELVPLVRKFPVADTMRLRIDGIIAQRTEFTQAVGPGPRPPLPDTAPRTDIAKLETAVLPTAPVRRIPVSPAALFRLVVVLSSLALGVIAFGLVTKLQQHARAARDERLSKLRDAKALLDSDPIACEKAAKELALSFEHAGYREEALSASEIVSQAGQKIADLEEKKRAEEAAAAYKEALKTVVEAQAKEDPRDPEKVASFELAVQTFAKLAEKYPGTAEGMRAERDRESARSRLEDAKKKRADREAREARARTDLVRTRDALRSLYQERHFEDVSTLIANFERENGSTELGKKATAEMRAELLENGRSALEEVRRRVKDAVAHKRWDEARAALSDLLLQVKGVKALEDPVKVDLGAVAAAEEDDRAAEVRRQDREKKAAAEEQAKPLVEQRQFEDAVTVFADASAKIRGSPDIQKAIDRRAERLRGAAAALKDLVLSVQEHRRGASVTHEGLVAEDASAGKLHFKSSTGKPAADLSIAQAPPDELHRWVIQAAGPHPDADALLHAASLALELGERELASHDLDAAVAVATTREQRERVDDLRAWPGE